MKTMKMRAAVPAVLMMILAAPAMAALPQQLARFDRELDNRQPNCSRFAVVPVLGSKPLRPVALMASYENACYPDLMLSGEVDLLIDGQVMAAKPLDGRSADLRATVQPALHPVYHVVVLRVIAAEPGTLQRFVASKTFKIRY